MTISLTHVCIKKKKKNKHVRKIIVAGGKKVFTLADILTDYFPVKRRDNEEK